VGREQTLFISAHLDLDLKRCRGCVEETTLSRGARVGKRLVGLEKKRRVHYWFHVLPTS